MEERYIQPISAGYPRSAAGMNRPANMGAAPVPMTSNTGNASNMSNAPLHANAAGASNMPKAPGMMNAGMTSPMGSQMNMMNKPNTGMMHDMMNKPNSGMMHDLMNKPNTGMMHDLMNKPNTGMMPDMMNKPNTGMMPDMMNKPNAPSNTVADKSGCDYKSGELPPCAPLSVGYVPFQQKNPPKYEKSEALTRGTLFPGLDLPWKNITNKSNPYAGTPLGELMALGFVIKELNLYLDTHPKDKDALDMLKQFNKLMAEGRDKYVKLYGPQTIMDITSGDEFTWLNDPWPWEYTEKGANENV